MDILDSHEINNRVKTKSIVVAILVYLWLASVTFGFALLLLGICAFITSKIFKKEIEHVTSNSNKFNKLYPLRYFGASHGDFEHIFYHHENIESSILETIADNLKTKANLTSIENINIIDTDPDLKSPDERKFYRIDSGSTTRGTAITLILRVSNYEGMQSVRWWALAGGYIDRDKQFNRAAYSMFTILFWIIPYIKNEYDILPGIRTIYPAYYNDMDISTKIKCLHEIVFQAMVDELENHDIDTSELKTQKMQVMNIGISGGKVNMGNIVQGGMNRISSIIGGAKK